MPNQLYASVTGCSSIESITVSDSHTAPTSSATITCFSSSLDVGDNVSVNLGYTGNHARVFEGYVKNVTRSQSPTKYEITCANAMIRAVDYFMASTNPLEPFSRRNITAQALIGDLMAEAGLNNYTGGNSGFTIGTGELPVEVNLVSVYDYSKFIADLLAWHLYADDNGTIHFLERHPFPDGGDPSVATINGANSLSLSYFRSDRDLRNRIVVYGAEGIYAEASASSPYLPGGFFKSVVIAGAAVIGSQGAAQQAANYNLAALNRLTVGGTATIIGNPNIACRDCVTVNRSDIGMSGKFYVYGCEHDWGKQGYTTNLDLRK